MVHARASRIRNILSSKIIEIFNNKHVKYGFVLKRGIKYSEYRNYDPKRREYNICKINKTQNQKRKLNF